jgi:hypothetical protein
MEIHRVTAQGDANETPSPCIGSAAKNVCVSGGVSNAQGAALWCKPGRPDPRWTLSAMWASSIVWAAANLADVFSTTVKNVKRSR